MLMKLLKNESNAFSVSDKMVSINGNSCYLIHGKCTWGEYSVWIDPNNGYLPRKLEMKKDENKSLLEGRNTEKYRR